MSWHCKTCKEPHSVRYDEPTDCRACEVREELGAEIERLRWLYKEATLSHALDTAVTERRGSERMLEFVREMRGHLEQQWEARQRLAALVGKLRGDETEEEFQAMMKQEERRSTAPKLRKRRRPQGEHRDDCAGSSRTGRRITAREQRQRKSDVLERLAETGADEPPITLRCPSGHTWDVTQADYRRGFTRCCKCGEEGVRDE